MELEIVNINTVDLRAMLSDPEVYVIKGDCFYKDRARMVSVTDADVKDVLNKKNIVVKITK